MPQSFSDLNLHLVFSTKDRRALIDGDLAPRLYEYLGGVLRTDGCSLMAAGGMPDHVHLLISMGRENSVAEILRLAKANSSKWVHETFDNRKDFAWQAGYGAFAVSHSNIGQVRRYIASQEQHHRKMTFQEEYLAFLQRHGISFDERYMWE